MRDNIERWWDSFVQLKWWVQAIIIMAMTIAIHHWILHQSKIMPKSKKGVKMVKAKYPKKTGKGKSYTYGKKPKKRQYYHRGQNLLFS